MTQKRADKPSKLDRLVEDAIAQGLVPGVAIAVAREDRVILSRAYGMRERGLRAPMRPDSIFQLASVSKTVTAVAVMREAEAGRLRLDAAADAYLPYAVRHPRKVHRPITVRALLTHTAGLRDDWDVLGRYYVYDRDTDVALGVFLERYLSPEGEHHHPKRNFVRRGPGKKHAYANIGAALLGHLVERTSGEAFDAYCDAHIFGPLGMKDTTWRVSEVRRGRVAWPYERGDDGRLRKGGLFSTPDYPDGQLCSTGPDLVRFASGLFGWSRKRRAVRPILAPTTLELMLTRAVPDLEPEQALLWYWSEHEGRRLVGHEGDETGLTTALWVDPEAKLSIVVLMNGEEPDERPLRDEIVDRILKSEVGGG